MGVALMSDIQPNPKPAFLDWNYRADCRCERDFGLDRTIFLNLGGGLIRTPEEIAKQMIDMLPIEVWNRNTTFLDPCCKSGVFLKYISDRLLVCPDLIEAFPNPRERVQHIQLKQLHGIAWTDETYWQCRKQVNRSIRDDEPNSIRLVPNLLHIIKSKEAFQKILKENFGRMNFDIVIGNILP